MLATNYQTRCYPISTVLVKIKLKVTVKFGSGDDSCSAGQPVTSANRSKRRACTRTVGIAIGGGVDLRGEGDRYGCNGGGEPDIFSRRSSSAFLWSSRTLANSWLAAAVLPMA